MINKRKKSCFCKDDISLIENYEKALNDSENIYDIHHRLEIDLNVSRQYLIDHDLYYNRPASELIFLTHSEHQKLHKKEVHHSVEIRQKMSEAHKGKKLSNEHCDHIKGGISKYYEDHDGYWKNKKLSNETKQKMSDSHKGKCPQNLKAIHEYQKLYGSPVKGKHRVYDENGKYHYE